MREKMMNERIRFEEDSNKVAIELLPPKVKWKQTLLTIWLALWYFIGIGLLYEFSLQTDSGNRMFIGLVLAFWIYFAFRITRVWLWYTIGKERIEFYDNYFTYGKKWGKRYGSKNYDYKKVTEFRRVKRKATSYSLNYESSYWVMGDEKLRMSFEGREHIFGQKLDEDSIRIVIQFFDKRLRKK